MTASFAGDVNFNPSSGSNDLTVTPASLTIIANDQSKIYGNTTTFTGTEFTTSTLFNGDTVTSATLTSAGAAPTAAVAGSPYAIVPSAAFGTGLSNYSISYVNGSMTVNTAPLTITADNQTKVYGAALPTLTASYTGFVNGDTSASLITLPTITTTADATSHVSGNPYSITANGAFDANYTISYVDGSLFVTTAPLTITADNQTKVYGVALPTLTASYTGFVNGDTSASLTTLPTATTTDGDVAGSPYAISASGAVDSDYSISYVDGNLAVTPAPLTITADDQTKVYGAAPPTLTVSYTGFVNGDDSTSLTTLPTVTTTATAASHVAGSPYAISASGAVDSNYTISYVDGNLAVTPAPLTITADNQSKVYGAALPTLTASFTGFVNGDTSANLTTAPTITTNATSASHVSGNPYTITADGAVDSDYTISYVDGNLDVTPAPLTIIADDQTKVSGAALPTLTASYTGFVNGDTSASLTTPPTVATTAIASSPAGTYPITPSGAADTDYAISYVSGTLTVTAAPTPTPPMSVVNDYDGDGKSDVAVYLASSGSYSIRYSSGLQDQVIPFGVSGEGQSITAPGDYDGDGKADLAVYIPSQGLFAYRPSGGGPDVSNQFGVSAANRTIPAPGDYFGTGKTDVAVYLADSGSFVVRNPGGGPDLVVPFGSPGDGKSIPVPGDFDGDGTTDLAVYLPEAGAFGFRPSSGGPDQVIGFGITGAGQSIPIAGDFDGDGKADLAAYLPSQANFAYRPSGGGPDVYNIFGIIGEGQTLPAPGDFAGDLRSEVAAYLPSQGNFAIRPGMGAPDSVFPFGTAGTGQTTPVTVVDEALTQLEPTDSVAAFLIPDTSAIVESLSVPSLASAKKKARS